MQLQRRWGTTLRWLIFLSLGGSTLDASNPIPLETARCLPNRVRPLLPLGVGNSADLIRLRSASLIAGNPA